MRKKSLLINNKPCFNLYSKKINHFLLFGYLFFLPTQLGKHFFFNFSYLSGVRVDYLALTFYLNDFIFILLLILNFSIIKNFLKSFKIIFLIAAINIFFALSKPVSFYYWLRVFEFLLIFIIFKKNKPPTKLILFAFLFNSIIESYLALNQLIFGHSLQGVFYFLGERFFSLSTPGVAKINLFGKEILRPYATFSHPNSLAGFYLLLYFYFLTEKKFNRFFLLKSFLLFLFTLMIFFSFSKIAIFTFLLLNIFFLRKNFKKCSVCQFSRFFILFVLGLIFFQGKGDTLTIEKRLILIKNAFLILKKTPFFGVGLGNYLIAQNNIASKIYLFFNQPVHNIFFLSLVELGLICWLFLMYFLIKKSKKILFANYYILAIILITGFLDHYWLTLTQNFFLMAVVFGLL